MLRWNSKMKSFRKNTFIARWQIVKQKIKITFSGSWEEVATRSWIKLGLRFISFEKCLNLICSNSKSSPQKCSVRKVVLRNFTKFTGKHLCQSLFFNKVDEKENLAQVFSCEYCEICKNTFHRTLLDDCFF